MAEYHEYSNADLYWGALRKLEELKKRLLADDTRDRSGTATLVEITINHLEDVGKKVVDFPLEHVP